MERVWERHFADSAQLLELAPNPVNSWVDLGSGAGFPGLVIAILLRERTSESSCTVILVESDARKAAFLHEVARITGVLVDIRSERIENLPTRSTIMPNNVISARALAPLDRLLELAAPYFGEKSIGLFPKGKGWEADIASALARWQFAYKLERSVTDDDGRIVVIDKFVGKLRG